ncbi:unnamed protein product [Pocillopora meandrina]|uniref:AIG1-type G domain-containing protein n=1 Tax=Pocillopora meandrina TaxID=46732 RepID=A0AAU9WY91_9CNID|nr:unnamed protein product [Pocillopora meandrina]
MNLKKIVPHHLVKVRRCQAPPSRWTKRALKAFFKDMFGDVTGNLIGALTGAKFGRKYQTFFGWFTKYFKNPNADWHDNPFQVSLSLTTTSVLLKKEPKTSFTILKVLHTATSRIFTSTLLYSGGRHKLHILRSIITYEKLIQSAEGSGTTGKIKQPTEDFVADNCATVYRYEKQSLVEARWNRKLLFLIDHDDRIVIFVSIPTMTIVLLIDKKKENRRCSAMIVQASNSITTVMPSQTSFPFFAFELFFNLHIVYFLLLYIYLVNIILFQTLLSRMAQEGTPEKSSDASATEVSQIIFGAKNLEYQIEQFVSSGGQTVNILLSGKTGVGKSHLTNALIGENLAAEGYDIDPQTNDVTAYEVVKNGVTITVFDTPGLADATGNDEEYLRKIKEKVTHFDLFLFCTEMTSKRFRTDDLETIKKLTEALGEKLWDHALVVLTFANEVSLSPTKKTADAPEVTVFNDRYLAFKKAIKKHLVAIGYLR